MLRRFLKTLPLYLALISSAHAGMFSPGVLTYSSGPPATISINLLAIAGGGGGGSEIGGDAGAGPGGAGEYIETTKTLSTSVTYTIIVGDGGPGHSSATRGVGTVGDNTTITGSGLTTVTALGGGYGCTRLVNGGDGGSGGGACGVLTNPGVSIASQGTGHDGGAAGAVGYGSGGGGASAAGSTTQSDGEGNGGAGTTPSLGGLPSGSCLAGGGGGGGAAGGSASCGGGPGGGTISGVCTVGTTNSGGGGGGAYDNTSGGRAGCKGGSGKVVIAYLGAQLFTGGTYSSSGGYSIHTFNSVGSATLVPL